MTLSCLVLIQLASILTVVTVPGSVGRIGRNVTLDTDPRIYPPKYQPEFDERFNISAYFTNPRILRHFVRCLFYGEVCDMVGKWAKPRVLTSVLGSCQKCTKEQENWPHMALGTINAKFPEMYRALIGRFLEYMGIQIPSKERRLVRNSFENSWDY